MKIVAAIPARGGSVGLPGKNIRPLNGIPLVGRTVRAARGSRFVSDVFVSSDSEQILSVARTFGAIGFQRPDDLSGPTASSESALLHLLRHEPSLLADAPDILVFLQCTAPFTLAHHVDQVVEALLSEDATSAISVVDDHGFYWQVGDDGAGVGLNHDPSRPRIRRQDISARYRENGAVYAMRVPEFLEAENRYCGKTILVPMDSTWIEIDTSQDWDIAEAFIKTEPFTGIAGIQSEIAIKAVVSGFDGVHTDNSVFVASDGTETIRCSRADEIGLGLLNNRGIRLLMLENDGNLVAAVRAKKLAIDFMSYLLDKKQALDQWRIGKDLAWSDIAFIGNDISDLACMQACGLSVAPRSAQVEAKAAADIVLDAKGGSGALREFCDLFLQNEPS